MRAYRFVNPRGMLTVALLVLLAGPAAAASVTASFEGILTVVQNVEGAGSGTPFSGSFTFDDAAALEVTGSDSGRYVFGEFPATGFTITIGSTEFAGGPLGSIDITDGASDSMTVIAQTGATGDFRLDVMGDAALLDSLDLAVPTIPPGTGQIQYTNLGGGFVLLMGTLTSLSGVSVPEPGAVALLGLALAALGCVRRRAR